MSRSSPPGVLAKCSNLSHRAKRHISRQTLLVLSHVLVERKFGVSDREMEQKRLLCQRNG